MSRYSAFRSALRVRPNTFFEALTEFPGPDAFFGQGPQPPLGFGALGQRATAAR